MKGVPMRKACMAAVAVLLAGCSNEPRPLSAHEELLVERLKNAPPKTIIVTHTTSGYSEFDVVCDNRHGKIAFARVGQWNCGSSTSAMNSNATAEYLVRTRQIHTFRMARVVYPTDSDYPMLLENVRPLLNDLRRKGWPTGSL